MKRLALFICTLLCANVLSAQTEFIVGNLKYNVTSSNPPEVAVGAADATITTANIPETVTYEGVTYSVTSIRNNAFYCNGLTSIDIPESVTTIGNGAFYDCDGLTSIDIPESVTSIGDYAFAYCSSLTSVTIGITIGNSVTSIGESAFRGCSSLTSVTIGNSVTSIGAEAFSFCSSLTSIDIPNSVTSIGDYAFAYCSSLTSITIPNSVTSIGEWAFKNCSSLTYMTIEMSSIPSNLFIIDEDSTTPFPLQNLTLGENVTSIASGAFNDCSFLQNVTCLATTPPTLEDNTVFPYPNIASLTVPCGTLEAYSSATSFWNMFFAGRISENGYNVEVSVNDETFGSVAVESDCSTGTLTATANEGYRFVIWNDGNTDNPREVTLTSDTAFTAIFAAIDESSLSEDAEVAKIGVYPNPTSGKVVFDKAVERVEVIDLVGKTIQTYENASEINIGALPAGVYHLRMSLEDQTITRMVIKE